MLKTTVVFFSVFHLIFGQCVLNQNQENLVCKGVDLNTINLLNYKEKIKYLTIEELINEEIPKNAFTLLNLERLYITNSRLKAINTESFQNLKKLNLLAVKNNTAWNIPNDFFASLSVTVKIVNFSFNLLTDPTLDTLYHSENIESLDLGHNLIRKLELGIFDEARMLKYLFLSQNKITEIPLGIFDGLHHLITLDLSNNPLKTIPLGVFDKSNKILNLKLYGTHLPAIELGTFDSLQSLKTLDLSSCPYLTSLPLGLFDENVNLELIYLGSNADLSLPLGIIDKNQKLITFSITGSKTILPTILSDGLIDQNRHLKLFYFPNNTATSINNSFVGKSALLVVNLSRNQLKSIESTSFINTSLSTIVISYNKLTELSYEFLTIKTLRIVYASNNKISYIKFNNPNLKQRMNLEHLDLSHNKLINLESNFFNSINNLNLMNINANPWDCKCLDIILNRFRDKKIKFPTAEYFEGLKPICIVNENQTNCLITKKDFSYYFNIRLN